MSNDLPYKCQVTTTVFYKDSQRVLWLIRTLDRAYTNHPLNENIRWDRIFININSKGQVTAIILQFRNEEDLDRYMLTWT